MIKMINRFLFFALLMSVAIPVSVFSQGVWIEAENYSASHDLGMDPIRPATLTGCSGNRILAGMDLPGEWTEYDLTVTDFGIYSVSMYCRGNSGQNYPFQMVLIEEVSGDMQLIDISFVGNGMG